jgi:predicted GNAT family acetyltransferase
VSLLHVAGGPTIVSLSAARAKEFALSDGECVEDADLSARIERAGVFLHDPDYLFYLALDEQAVLNGETWPAGTRQLTDRDSAVFDEFTAQAPDDELDEAFVELDHWMVFGTFVDDNLVCAASMYPWRGTQLADLGVITLPEFRGRALGRATVRAMSAAALARGYEPQYRCQLDNVASVALARAAGFSLFGEWEVIDAED